jgi:hypothetical protein
LEFIVTLAIIGFLGWVGFEIYKVKFPAHKRVQPDPYSYLKAPDQGLTPPSTGAVYPHTHGPPTAPPASLKHEIVEHRLMKEYDGSYVPEWVCKCGATGFKWVHNIRTMESAQREAVQEGQAHVREQNKAEELLAKTNGKFAF